MAKTLNYPEFVLTLEQALKGKRRNAQIDVQKVGRTNRYRFIVVWNRFDRMGHPERQRKVWDIADAELEPADLLKEGMIITLGAKDLVRD